MLRCRSSSSNESAVIPFVIHFHLLDLQSKGKHSI
jgi:hypothetical protein